MKLWLKPSQLPKVIQLTSSKSYANRYLILGALNETSIKLVNLPESEDTFFLIDALKVIGCNVKMDIDALEIKGPFPDVENLTNKIIDIDVGESGTTARFLTVLLALGKNKYKLKMQGKLSQRPWEELISKLKEMGVSIHLENNFLYVQGPLNINTSTLEIESSRSTQFASALALVLSGRGITVHPKNIQSSKLYWEMTEKILKNKKNIYHVPLDWSSAAPLIAFASINNQEVFFPNLYEDNFQADSAFGKWLLERKALEFQASGVQIFSLKKRDPFNININQMLDSFPVWCFVAAHLNGTSTISGLSALQFKESDRLKACVDILKKLNVKVKLDNEFLSITGPVNIKQSIHLDPEFDHRVVMMAALFSATHQGGQISNVEAVGKSYSSFFRNFNFTE